MARDLERRTAIPASPLKTRQESRPYWLSFLGGCFLALIFLEVVLHNLAGKTEGSFGIEQRSFTEGIAKSHFSPEGLRMTGNVRLTGASSLLLVGDSHVEAFQVQDEQTMGSILERRLRADGKPYNVLQYGWSGADGPDYVFAAPLFKEHFPSNEIVFLMNAGDFASSSTTNAHLVARNDEVVAEASTAGSVRGRPPSFGDQRLRKVKESGLFYSIAVRFVLDLLPQLTEHKANVGERDLAATGSSQETVHLIVRALKGAYGDKIFILYTPAQPFSQQTPPEAQEVALLSDCKVEGLECRSLRGRMIDDLLVRHKLARGFLNTAPGEGHLNARGHELAAEEMYQWVNSSH